VNRGVLADRDLDDSTPDRGRHMHHIRIDRGIAGGRVATDPGSDQDGGHHSYSGGSECDEAAA